MKNNIPTAIALFLGIIIGSVLPPLGVKAQDDVLYASKIIIPDDGLVFETSDGKGAIWLGANNTGGAIHVMNNEGQTVAGLDVIFPKPAPELPPELRQSFNDSSGRIFINNNDGYRTVAITDIKYGGEAIFYNSEGQVNATVGADIRGSGCGDLNLFNAKEHLITNLGGSLEGNGSLKISNAEGQMIATLGSTPEGNGALSVSNTDGSIGVLLGTIEAGGGLVLSNNGGELAAILCADEEGGRLTIRNYYAGGPVLALGTTKSHGYVNVYNTDGEPVWGSP